jgi:hypothetical protein
VPPEDFEGFVAKLDANLSTILAATFLGGSGVDAVLALALDGMGSVYVAGRTTSSVFPGVSQGSVASSLNGAEDAFIAKLDANLTSILAATFLGGSGHDGAFALALAGTGHVYVAGVTASADFPGVSAGSADPTFAAAGFGFEPFHISIADEAFVAKVLAKDLDGKLGPLGGDIVDSLVPMPPGPPPVFRVGPEILPLDVAVFIEVLPDLDVAAPPEFIGPATRFVDFTLDPNPGTLPPPGATIVLPLAAALPAGTRLDLFTFVPPSSLTATRVAGTVDVDSLTATFKGVTEFSVFVAFQAANQSPVANAGADQVVPAGVGCLATVTLDGTGSSDLDGHPLTYAWTGAFGTASGPTPMVALPLGIQVITLTVDDGHGGTDTDTVSVTVGDTTPPSMGTVTASPDVLWPPNHQLVPVTVGVSVSDVCDATPICQISAVSSNEPVEGLGDGDTAPDWQVTGALTVDLRAERSGTGHGRVYTLTVQCTDASANRATTTGTVTVPHDQRKK